MIAPEGSVFPLIRISGEVRAGAAWFSLFRETRCSAVATERPRGGKTRGQGGWDRRPQLSQMEIIKTEKRQDAKKNPRREDKRKRTKREVVRERKNEAEIGEGPKI